LSGRRLSDLVSVGVLTKVFPPWVVDEVVAATGRREQRSRSLPARVMTYFAVGMALHAEGSYEDVLSQITDGLSWGSGWSQEYRPPGKSAIFQARARLGYEPVRALFERVAVPLATPAMSGAWLSGLRMVAVDGFCLDLPDTPANEEYFGRAGVNKGERAAFPMARVLALAECATHAVFAAQVGAYREGEATLLERLLPSFRAGMLVLGDRGMFSYDLWRKAAATGADLLWRIRTDAAGPKPVFVEELPDGSWLGRLQRARPKTPGHPQEPMLVRVIDYEVDDGRDNAEEYRLFTTVLDPAQADAADLAAAYGQRWEIETTFDELKTHQRGPRAILRSRSPDLVLQEIWGHLCCHYAIRCLMVEAAVTSGHDPDRVSFTAALRITRQSLAGTQGAFSPSGVASSPG
jgi:Insertion element 4 transposase N-terminal/Transposase DDE domain